MAANPYMKLFVGDWIRDTRMLTNEEKGVWIDLLTFMHTNQECGFVAGTWSDVARLVGENDAAKLRQIVLKIQAKGICDLEQIDKQIFDEHETVKIVNRRMFRAFQISEKRRKAGAKGGQNSQAKNKQNKIFFESSIKQNCGYGSGNGNEGIGGMGEKETDPADGSGFIIPRMAGIFYGAYPTYPQATSMDYPALLEIAEFISGRENILIAQMKEKDIETILASWLLLSEFIAAHRFFKKYSLSQVSRHIQSIILDYTDKSGAKDSTIDHNLSAGLSALQILAQKFKGNETIYSE